MSTSFRRINSEEVDTAHSAYIAVYDWLNAKGIRQWLHALSKEIFTERQRDGQLLGFYIDNRLAAVVTLAFEISTYWTEAIGSGERWWVKSLAVVRHWRGEEFGKRVMKECEMIIQGSGAREAFLDCVDTGFLPRYYASLGYEVLAQKEISYPSGNAFPMVLMKKKMPIHTPEPTARRA